MLELKKIYLVIIACTLMILGWPPLPTALLLFVGLVPLLIIHHQLIGSKRRHLKFWAWTYLVLLIFNIGCTWWVWNASPTGCLFMLFANSLIMSLPFLVFSLTHSALPKTGYLSLIFYFLSMEYLHFNWNGSWPWMTFGKGLAAYPWFIQWYEFTGEMGGTLLILFINIWIFKIIKRATYKDLWQPGVTIVSVALLSFLLSFSEERIKLTSSKAIECIIAQPNIDPYEEKFGDGQKALSPEAQLAFALDISKPLRTQQTRLLVLPETAVVGWNNEKRLNESSLIKPMFEISDSLGLVILTGAETFNTFSNKSEASIVARYDSFFNDWFDVYNTALLIKDNKIENIYHKSKLVPGVEQMPFDFLEKLSISLGGASGSLAKSAGPVNFRVNEYLTIAPLVCYESVFGDYVNEFVKNGANALAVITNDGWWGNTPGYKQHLLFGAIRCIETRKEMLRSANTGVSAKINCKGYITHQTVYDERTAFRCFVQPNNFLTFYVRYGNLIGKFSVVIALFFLIFTFLKSVFEIWHSRIK